MRRRIGVAGAGAWGQALAHVARLAGHDVAVWSRGNAQLPRSDAIILAVPAQAVREVLSTIKPSLHKGQPLIIGAKGIEQSTGLFMN
jgi:glycerol-3-phosphate dehydrogenase (NAD(P)+)